MSLDALALATVALPLIAAAVAAASGAQRARFTLRFGAACAGAALLLVAGLAIGTGLGAIDEIRGHLVSVDRLAILLLVLICGVSAVVQLFAVRYLHGDDRAGWFSASAGLLTAATSGMVVSATLVGFAVCWTLAGVALWLLLATYRHLPAARQGLVRTVAAFAVGDLALWAAVTVVTVRVGNVEIDQLGAALAGEPAVVVTGVSLLIVLAALARSAQIPFHRWLPATLAAPTPVSALLHAGVVNGGGVLLVRTGGLTGQATVAMTVAAVAGGLTILYGTAAMLTKPDVKGALVHSTSAQMGFMIFTCALGLYGAAVFHLVAHGMYKATRFLNSGSALLSRDRVARRAPISSVSQAKSGAAAVVLSGLAAAAAMAVVPGALHADGVALMIFGWVTVAALSAGWLRQRRSARAVAAAFGVLTALGVAYLTAVEAVTGFIAGALPPAAHLPTAWPVAVVATALAALLTIRRLPAAGRTEGLHHSAYTAALNAGHVATTKGALR